MINTSVIIPAIISDGLSRRIVVQEPLKLHTVNDALRELWATQKSWNRRGLTKKQLGKTFELLFRRISVLQPSDYAPALAEAYSTMQPIDEDDTPFLAAAIHLNCPIWSNDQDFARQKRVQVYTTFQLAKILKIVRSSTDLGQPT